MSATSYSLLLSGDSPREPGLHYVHHQMLQVGDVIQTDTRSKYWYRVVDIRSRGLGERVAQLSEAAESEALAHNPKLTPR